MLGPGRRGGRCQRGLRFTGRLERREPIKTLHYLGEGLVFFIALSGGCNLVVLQFQWLKRQFRSSQFLVKSFFFLCVCFLGKVSDVKLLTEYTLPNNSDYILISLGEISCKLLS